LIAIAWVGWLDGLKKGKKIIVICQVGAVLSKYESNLIFNKEVMAI